MGGASGGPRYDGGMCTNRTAVNFLFCLAYLCGSAAAQSSGEKAVQDPQVSTAQLVVSSVEKAETALTSLRMRISTIGRLPGGLDVVTKGELRVLRTTHGDGQARMFSKVEYTFGDGLSGEMESSRAAAGITIFEKDPAFGAVFLLIPPDLVADLEWASVILQKSDLPGMSDSRAQSPLGSGMVKDLLRTFDLTVADSHEFAGDQGIWLRGPRRAGIDAQDPDLPLADRVEVFVRDRDHAVLLTRFYVGADVVQEVKVESLAVGVEFVDADFTVDGHGERIRNVRGYAPMYEQIEEAISSAEAKAKDGDLSPRQLRNRDAGRQKDKAQGAVRDGDSSRKPSKK